MSRQQNISKKNIIFFLFLILLTISIKSIEAEVVITQQVSGEGLYTSDNLNYYIPGKSINITISFANNSTENVLALGLQCFVPQGWQFQGISTKTNAPAVYPQPAKVSDGTTPFEFAWVMTPSFPFNFTFSVNIPSDSQGAVQIKSQSLYRYTGGQLTSKTAQTSFEEAIIPQEGEGEGEKLNCMQRIIKGCNPDDSDPKNQAKKFILDLLFIFVIIGTLGISTKNNRRNR